MVEFDRPEIKICPYWRKFVTNGDRALALCAIESPSEKLPEDTDLGPRLRRCPWGWTKKDAYQVPSIILVNSEDEADAIHYSTWRGKEGIRALGSRWSKAVKKFYGLVEE